jgi:hypothetical protein
MSMPTKAEITFYDKVTKIVEMRGIIKSVELIPLIPAHYFCGGEHDVLNLLNKMEENGRIMAIHYRMPDGVRFVTMYLPVGSKEIV